MPTNVIIRVFKSWGARDPERRWVNSYEAHSIDGLWPDAFEPMKDAIVTAEKAIHHANVQFLEATISTWEVDSHPYDPTSFFTYELSGSGAVDAPHAHDIEVLDSNVCYLVKRQTHGGRSGKLFYRGCLLETDVRMGGDARFTLEAGSNYQEGGAFFTTYKAALAPYIGDDAVTSGTYMALISLIANITTVRAVELMKVGGVTVNRRNHRYFDRAP